MDDHPVSCIDHPDECPSRQLDEFIPCIAVENIQKLLIGINNLLGLIPAVHKKPPGIPSIRPAMKGFSKSTLVKSISFIIFHPIKSVS